LRVDDEFDVDEATDYVIKYVRRAFNDLSIKYRYKYIVEKTENNTLRINFVNKIFPEAKFIFVIRDGRDVIASMLKRRHQSIDPVFLLKKARYLPLSDISVVTIRYFKNMFRRYFFNKRIVYQLGPVFKGMEKMLSNHTEAEIVAMQWAKCLEKANKDLNKIDSDRSCIIKYEELVKNPKSTIFDLIKFLNIKLSKEEINIFINNILISDLGKETASSEMKIVKGISDKHVEIWKRELDDDTLHSIMPVIENTMNELGY